MSETHSGDRGNVGAGKARAVERSTAIADTLASGSGHTLNDDDSLDLSMDQTLPGGAAPDGDDLPELPTRAPRRYQRRREIARGGMGRIISVRDLELGRTLAIKELLSADRGAALRFEREVRITSRLQHPAIIGILEAGRWPDGRLFYTMKHVDGRGLDRVIASKSSLVGRMAFLANVIAVADALAYAHSQHIIHRDLKPANVLVGEFGETVVIDWGLGKDLSDPAGDEAPPSENRSIDATVTMFGDAVGTPAYMPPEQARGKRVDERADVYSLGAVLYHLLAGRPPYADTDPESADSLLERVIASPPTPLAELEPEAPADLLALVDKAMARQPEARYATAKELADDLKRYATGQLVSAHAYSTTALIRRWIRRHRAIVVTASVMLMVLLAGAGAGFLRLASERDRAEQLKLSAELNRGELEELMDFMLGDLRVKLEPIGRLDLLDMVSGKAAAYYARRPVGPELPQQARKRARALVNLGDVQAEQGELENALAQQRAALEIRTALVRINPANMAWQSDLALSHNRVGTALRTRGDLAGALPHHRAALAIAERVADSDPANTAWQRSLAICHERVGGARAAAGDHAGALHHYRSSLALTVALTERDPDSATWRRDLAFDHQNVGGVLKAQGDLDGALRHFRIALEILDQPGRQDPGNARWQRALLVAHEKVGGLLRTQGVLDGALTHQRAALVIAARLVERDPANVIWQRDLAYANTNVGELLRMADDLDGAIVYARAGMEIAARLAASDRSNIEWQNDAAVSYAFTGAALRARGDLGEAMALQRKCAEAYAAHARVANDFYNAACCFALTADADRAFAMLAEAVARGFRNTPALTGDPDLASLRSDKRWPALLAAVAAPSLPRSER